MQELGKVPPANVEVANTKMEDLPFIFQLFEYSITYQDLKGYPVWRNYDKGAIVKDIENGNQYKIVIDSVIAIVFSVAYNDKLIWRELDQGQSIYLHRIVVNPDFKGKKLFGLIVEWAVSHIHDRKLSSLRMDTWADNFTIINYYKTFGFEVIENYTTPDSDELPTHNRRLAVTLMEYRKTGREL